ncbi:MAG TPA: hypothetical protein DEP13_04715 [Gammaproteobacteria bacterium]|nr:hypothetical protein [Gammaproteobacteria bacterium]
MAKEYNEVKFDPLLKRFHSETAMDVRTEHELVQSDVSGVPGASSIANIISLTQAQYDAISAPDANTFYIIT